MPAVFGQYLASHWNAVFHVPKVEERFGYGSITYQEFGFNNPRVTASFITDWAMAEPWSATAAFCMYQLPTGNTAATPSRPIVRMPSAINTSVRLMPERRDWGNETEFR